MQPVSNPHASHKDKDFVPKDELSRLITEESVAEELIKFREQTQRTIDEIQTCAHQICSEELVPNNKPCNNEEMEGCLRTYRKIFAILVLIEKTTSIFLFLHHQVSDLDLPLVLVKDPEEPGLKRLQRRPDADGKPSTEIPIFETWSPWQMSSFEDSQWRFLAPFFSRGGYNDVKHFPLRENHILPFIPFNGISTATTKDSVIEKIDCGEGGYGKVMMVRIHPAHHNFHVNGAGTLTSGAKESMKFAIKQLLRPDRVSFKKEVSILKKFTGAGAHPHVVSLLATYEQFEKFHLIFYKADCDLCRLWRDAERKNPMSREEVLWMARQCEGIANGLLMLHRHFTRSRTSSITRISSNPPVEEKQTMTGAKRAPSAEDKSVSFGPPPPQTRQRADKEPLGERSHATLSIPTSTHVGLPADRSGCRDAGARPAKLVEMLEPQGEFIRQYGRHGDLKPQNILYYSDDPNILSSAPDSPITNAMTVIDCVDAPPQPESESTRGNLKICDFGHAELNSLYSKSRVRSSVANTMTYRPPECDVQPKIVRQSYDIWSLGCVYLEFVAWMLGGWELVKQFGEKRLARDRFQNWMSTDTFFTIYYCDKKGKAMAKIKSAVTDFIANLHCHPNCTEFFHDFLNLIRLNMLVIEPNDQSMTRRAYCEEIHLTLASLRKKCLSDNEYATTKNPWKTDRLTTMVSEPVEVDITDPGRAQLLEYKEFLREGISLVEKNLVTPPRGANSSRVPASV
jgi:serine/threonine protein kinase